LTDIAASEPFDCPRTFDGASSEASTGVGVFAASGTLLSRAAIRSVSDMGFLAGAEGFFGAEACLGFAGLGSGFFAACFGVSFGGSVLGEGAGSA
jgi:hypothetical protein